MDDLKALNDEHGHQAGNRGITTVASAIQRAIRNTDMAARSGGDEFLVFLPDATAEVAEIVAIGAVGYRRKAQALRDGSRHVKEFDLAEVAAIRVVHHVVGIHVLERVHGFEACPDFTRHPDRRLALGHGEGR